MSPIPERHGQQRISLGERRQNKFAGTETAFNELQKQYSSPVSTVTCSQIQAQNEAESAKYLCSINTYTEYIRTLSTSKLIQFPPVIICLYRKSVGGLSVV